MTIWGKEVHTRTVSRVVNQSAYHARVAQKKPYISKINLKKRVEIANEIVCKDSEFWNKVILF